MKKISITMASGSMLVKPLVTAFRGASGEYIVLDNEINGSMGLPIILVTKLSNNRLVKITDQNEWNAVKDILRNIISGNQMDYIDVPENLSGDDMFFSQLTLPVASFEVLKNNYKTLTTAQESPNQQPSQNTQTVSNAQPNQFPQATLTQQPSQISQENAMPQNNQFSPAAPISQEGLDPQSAPIFQDNSASQSSQNVLEQKNDSFVSPFTSTQNVDAPVANPFIQPQTMGNMEQTQVAPEPVNSMPVSQEAAVDYSDEKEAFLQACGNMFDALVAKFNK